MWDLKEGIAKCRKLESIIAPVGYHVALAGSVMRDGFSEKDLDIIIYPHDSANMGSPEQIFALIADHHANCFFCDEKYTARDPKCVIVGTDNDTGKRIDFFILK